MVQILFKVEITTLPSQVKGGSAFWYDLKMKQFVSYNRSPKNGILLMRLRKLDPYGGKYIVLFSENVL